MPEPVRGANWRREFDRLLRGYARAVREHTQASLGVGEKNPRKHAQMTAYDELLAYVMRPALVVHEGDCLCSDCEEARNAPPQPKTLMEVFFPTCSVGGCDEPAHAIYRGAKNTAERAFCSFCGAMEHDLGGAVFVRKIEGAADV